MAVYQCARPQPAISQVAGSPVVISLLSPQARPPGVSWPTRSSRIRGATESGQVVDRFVVELYAGDAEPVDRLVNVEGSPAQIGFIRQDHDRSNAQLAQIGHADVIREIGRRLPDLLLP